MGRSERVPEWTNRFKMEGDIRLRAQQDFYADRTLRCQLSSHRPGNRQHYGRSPGTAPHASWHQRERYQGMDMGMRLATGNGPEGTGSYWATFLTGGIPGLHVADLRNLQPVNSASCWIRISQAHALGLGTVSRRAFPQPLLRGHAREPIYWRDPQRLRILFLSRGSSHRPFMGRGLELRRPRVNLHPWMRENRTDQAFFNAGIYPLQQINQSETVKAKDKWFYGAQAGIEWVPEDVTPRSGSALLITISGYRRRPQPKFRRYLLQPDCPLVPAKRQQPLQYR